ncbi:MAG TPA: PaaI family thioesterase [candidate division Zixibacteria bacterium]|nr:PaaI family thioesterase [candidate division Zixibacteria bacterium]
MSSNDSRTRKAHGRGHGSASHVLQNHCFGCGQANPDGLRLRFELSPSGRSFVCRFRLGPRWVGPPGHAHGGVIATILDEAMGKANKLRQVIALTREMTVEYLRPVPLRQWLTVEGHTRAVRGRAQHNVAEIRNESGEVLARSRGKFIVIDPEKMFAKHIKGRGRALSFMQRGLQQK